MLDVVVRVIKLGVIIDEIDRIVYEVIIVVGVNYFCFVIVVVKYVFVVF